jgi:hypothetical protein
LHHRWAVHLWDRGTGKELRTRIGEGVEIRSVAFSPDSKTLALGCMDLTVRLVDLDTEKEIRRVVGKFGTFSPDGKLLATTRQEPDALELWDAATGNRVDTLEARGWVFYVAFSPDGRFLAPPGPARPGAAVALTQPAARPRTFRLGPSFLTSRDSRFQSRRPVPRRRQQQRHGVRPSPRPMRGAK